MTSTPQLHQQTKADEEYTALKQQQLEQRMGRASCRFAALVAVCTAADVPEIREDLLLPPPQTIAGGEEMVILSSSDVEMNGCHQEIMPTVLMFTANLGCRMRYMFYKTPNKVV